MCSFNNSSEGSKNAPRSYSPSAEAQDKLNENVIQPFQSNHEQERIASADGYQLMRVKEIIKKLML